MLVIVPIILIIAIIINFQFINSIEYSNKVGKNNIDVTITRYIKNIKNVYNQEYSYIHLNNYKRYKNSKERYFNLVLFHDKICRISNLTNACYNTGQRSQCFSKGKTNVIDDCEYIKDFAQNEDELRFLKRMTPPKVNKINRIYYKIGLLFNGVNLIHEYNGYIPVLGMSTILYTKKNKAKFVIDKIKDIDTYSNVQVKIKTANNILDTYSKIIRENAKYHYKNNPNQNPYAFKYAGSNLMYVNDEGEIGGFKYINLNGVLPYGLDTSLMINLPNSFSYEILNNKSINKDNPPLNTSKALDLTLYKAPKEDTINNLEDNKYIYKLESNDNGKLRAYEIDEWDKSNDILYALLYLGSQSDYDGALNLLEFKKYYFFNKYNRYTLIGNDEYRSEYEDIYHMWYKYSNFVGLDNFGAVQIKIRTDENGRKIASIYKKTFREYLKDNFKFEDKKFINPFFGDLIDFTILIDNSSNLNYPYSSIDKTKTTIFDNYSIAFGLPYIVDYDDYKSEDYSEENLNGIMFERYNIGVVN